MTELPSLGKEYTVMFEMFVNPISKAQAYYSILRIGTGISDAGVYGDRNPGFWIKNTKELTVASSISGNLNNYKFLPIEEKKWITVEASQTLKDGKVREGPKNPEGVVAIFSSTDPQQFFTW